jgi:hypothetical protein
MKQPSSLFKFVSEERVNILENGMIRFTPAHGFNDPFELEPWLTHLSRCWIDHLELSQPSTIEFDDEDYRFSNKRFSQLDQYRMKLENHSKQIGILSLSASFDTSDNPAVLLGNPDDPRRNLLMWAHYAASHTGFVIEFQQDFLDGLAQEVLYSEERPIATFEDIDAAVNISHLRKSKEWGYENEWRYFKRLKDADKLVLDEKGDPVHLFRFNKEAVKSVTFGCRASDKTKEAVLRILGSTPEYKSTATFFARIDQELFDLSFHQEFHRDGRIWSNEFGAVEIHVQNRIGTY